MVGRKEWGLKCPLLQEIKLLRDLVLKGKWDEAERFIRVIEGSDKEAHRKVSLLGPRNTAKCHPLRCKQDLLVAMPA